jgi:O-antigen ligase
MNKGTRSWVPLAGPAVTFAFSPGLTYDSFNSIKLLILGVLAGLIVSESLGDKAFTIVELKSPRNQVSILFIISLLVPLVFSQAPVSQQIFGAYGRNLGFLHYFFLVTIFIAVSRMRTGNLTANFLTGLIITGAAEAIYGFIQYIGLDPLPWVTPSEWISGTLGNPDYFSSFLAMATIGCLFRLTETKSKQIFLFLSFLILFQTVIIFLSHAIQGVILVAIGVALFLGKISFAKSKYFGFMVITTSFSAAIISILGIFQRGPAKALLYKESVAFRGDYWRAGIAMAKSHWLHGVGLDSYGDFYRQYRDITAANRRGLDVLSNSAHNLFIDLFATGGFLLCTAYLLLMIFALVSYLKNYRNGLATQPEGFSLFAVILAFHFQTIISINVASLAIWGWVGAALLAQSIKPQLEKRKNKFHSKSSNTEKNELLRLRFIPLLVFIAVVLPLIWKDANLRSAFYSNKVTLIQNATSQFPRDGDQMGSVALAFSKLGLDHRAYQLAKDAIKENPQTFSAWDTIAKSKFADSTEIDRALNALSKIEPNLH